jgi:endonuclease/exonuclease/phosphatase family metal-dependent hydrolase
MSIRVATYNVLSSSLCSPTFYCNVDNPDDCRASVRFPRILDKVRVEIEKESIICLQELSLEWTGKLLSFFNDNHYEFIVTNYERSMGVGIAFPSSKYKLLQANLIHVDETKVGGWKVPEQSCVVTALKRVASIFVTLEPSPWYLAKRRENRMVCLRLMDHNGQEFVVATYHMPCRFWSPAAMTILTAMCFQALEQITDSTCPVILAGDFNFKPTSPQYSLVTRGWFDDTVDDPDDPLVHGKPSYPHYPLYPDDPFTPFLSYQYKSAYREAYDNEPFFTNHAMTGKAVKPFTETLDYIFFRGTLVVSDVKYLWETPRCASYPTEDEPSDHLLIAAEFLFK